MGIIFDVFNFIINWLYSIVGDWGVVIILATMLIRFCLLPLSLRQKRSLTEQQELSKRMEEIKLKHENDKDKQQQEMAKLSSESMKSMLGCLVTLLQIPIMYSLYRVFSEMPAEVGSIIVPWISNLKLPDAYHIIPFIAVLIQLLPGIITAHVPVKEARQNGLRWPQLLFMGGLSMLFFIKAPVTLGIYWISSGLFSTIELVLYNRLHKPVAAVAQK